MSAKKTGDRNRMTSENIALCGILLALSAGISVAESLIPLPLGVKPGFSNLPVMFSMARQGTCYGFCICLLKSLFVLLTRGFTAFLMSLSGGILSYLLMVFLYKKTDSSVIFASISGAVLHNIGQLFTASIILNTSVFGYSPIMIVSGIIAGTATGTVLKILLERINLNKIY